jgi:hypothetical protein
MWPLPSGCRTNILYAIPSLILLNCTYDSEKSLFKEEKRSCLNCKSCILQKMSLKLTVNIHDVCKLLVQNLYGSFSTNTTQADIQTVFGFETVSNKSKMLCDLIIK